MISKIRVRILYCFIEEHGTYLITFQGPRRQLLLLVPSTTLQLLPPSEITQDCAA